MRRVAGVVVVLVLRRELLCYERALGGRVPWHGRQLSLTCAPVDGFEQRAVGDRRSPQRDRALLR